MSADTTTKQFKKQLPRNLIMKAVSFSTSVLVGLWLVPYLIDHLGVAAYGMVPLAAVFTQYVGIIAHALTTPVLRFLTVELKSEFGKPLAVFNSALVLFVGLGVLQLPLIFLLVGNLEVCFSVPDGILEETRILFFCSASNYILTFVAAIFGVSFYSSNRLDLEEGIRTVQQLLRPLCILLLFALDQPSLALIGYVDLSLGLLVFIGKLACWKKLTPELCISLSAVSLKMLLPVFKMAGWLLVNYLGFLLYLRVNVWIANKFIGPEAAGQYGALLIMDRLIRNGASIFSFVLSPMIMIYYSKGAIQSAVKLARLAEKILMGVFAVPCALLCVFSPWILSYWLGDDFKCLWPVLVAVVGHLFVNAGAMPLFQLHNAYNKVKFPAVLTLLLGFCNVVLGIIATAILKMDLMSVAVITATLLTAKNILIIPFYTSQITNQPKLYFVVPILLGGGWFICVLAVGCVALAYFKLASLEAIATTCVLIGLVSLGLFLVFALTNDEKKLVLNVVPAPVASILRRLRFIV